MNGASGSARSRDGDDWLGYGALVLFLVVGNAILAAIFNAPYENVTPRGLGGLFHGAGSAFFLAPPAIAIAAVARWRDPRRGAKVAACLVAIEVVFFGALLLDGSPVS